MASPHDSNATLALEEHNTPHRSEVSSTTDESDDTLTPQISRHPPIPEEQYQEIVRVASEALPADSPVLNPDSKDFDLYQWLCRIVSQLRDEGIPRKKSSIYFRNLRVTGTGAALQLQQTVGSLMTSLLRPRETFNIGSKAPKQILKQSDGILDSGELLLVLGRPGAGCSTFLKSLCGELHGLKLDRDSEVHYSGIPQSTMRKQFKGEMGYNQEVDKHFPHLTVGQTLEFAASVRTPSARLQGMSRSDHSKLLTKVVMAVYGLSHTYNTKVGNDTVRGVSGGERKRVSIAEMALAGTPLAAWDNSTRGLDAATALKFVQSLRLAADIDGSAHAVAAYQASQAIYDLFDKAVVLYEGRQIYYGSARAAKAFFERQGWYCPPRQTTGDFLTSVTNPVERRPRPGMEAQVPRTPDEFEAYWHNSPEYQGLQSEMAAHHGSATSNVDEKLREFQQQKRQEQAQHTRANSPYMLSVPMQIKMNTRRAYQRVWNERTSTITSFVANCIIALIVGSVFYGTPNTTAGFYQKGAVLFYAVLLNALTAMTEINSLYSQRPIVEKHNSYAFYHPATEAIAGIFSDIPVKFLLAVAFNIILYFLSNLRREPSQFFIYFLINFIVMFVMSAVFRTMAAITKSVSQAMTLAGILILALVIYTGFVVPVPYMHPWFGWIRYINPIYYAFEILVANEFHGREFGCAQLVPSYPNMSGTTFVCSQTGAVAGEYTVSGDAYIWDAFHYTYDNVWRNFGILIGFLVGFLAIYFAATEINSSTTSAAEVLVFRRGHEPPALKSGEPDEESGSSSVPASRDASDSEDEKAKQAPSTAMQPHRDVFTWRDVTYDIEIKGEPRRLLDQVSGWVKPGTLTALMGVSGAGKTTLLDVLAHRTSTGVITGDMFVNGRPLDSSFQRKTGYVQQQDLHLETATVRESLRFSAMLRQPDSVSKQEKYAYVEEVIRMLNMEEFAEAVVGEPGQGLNVEQRKLLTIGVELAAKPKLLLFLDEPTSGLDSQSSWAICNFLRKLADAGQAILCTIHQPSAILFQEFDQLLFLARGGKTVYFGPIGENSTTLLDYFERQGARPCSQDENPAEYMLEVVNAGANQAGENWFDLWQSSPEAGRVQDEINRIHTSRQNSSDHDEHTPEHRESEEFAMPLSKQLPIVMQRVFQQYWRMPMYIAAKMMLGLCSGLFIGFSFFQPDTSMQGLQNTIFSLFMVCAIFSSLVQQVIPLFLTQRALYETRERPSKTYSWKAFIASTVAAEIPYQIFMGVLVYGCYYYAVVGVQSSARQGLALLFFVQFFVYASTFADLVIAALPDAETAGAIVTLLFSMALTFNGVMQPPDALPRFWIFMYRVSPFTYWVGGVAAAQLHNRPVRCSPVEVSIFDPPDGMTCAQYMRPYLQAAPGYLSNGNATQNCEYCSLSTADQYLASVNMFWGQRWRNFGLFWAFIAFDIAAAVLLYYAFRIMKWNWRFGKKKKN